MTWFTEWRTGAPMWRIRTGCTSSGNQTVFYPL